MPIPRSAPISEERKTTWSTRLRVFGWETRTAGGTTTSWIHFVMGSRFRSATVMVSDECPLDRTDGFACALSKLAASGAEPRLVCLSQRLTASVRLDHGLKAAWQIRRAQTAMEGIVSAVFARLTLIDSISAIGTAFATFINKILALAQKNVRHWHVVPLSRRLGKHFRVRTYNAGPTQIHSHR